MTDLASIRLDDLQPRRPVIAALLSFAMPGLGQLYNGQLNAGLWTFLGFVAAGALGITLAALYVPAAAMLPLLVLSVVATLGLWLGAIVQAWRGAQARQVYARRGWQVSGLYAVLLVAGHAALYSLIVDTIRQHGVQAFSIPSSSMEPGILKGDFLFADKRYNCPGCKTRVAVGDIGIFVYPNDRTAYYIKRVIGLPGDHVTVSGRVVTVNGRSLAADEAIDGDRITATEQAGERRWRVTWNRVASGSDLDLLVPPGHVFLLGDNRDGSTDSRSFGVVPLADLVGKARQVWFSRGDEGIRWQRLGTVLD